MRRIDEVIIRETVDKLSMKADRMIREGQLTEAQASFYYREALKDIANKIYQDKRE